MSAEHPASSSPWKQSSAPSHFHFSGIHEPVESYNKYKECIPCISMFLNYIYFAILFYFLLTNKMSLHYRRNIDVENVLEDFFFNGRRNRFAQKSGQEFNGFYSSLTRNTAEKAPSTNPQRTVKIFILSFSTIFSQVAYPVSRYALAIITSEMLILRALSGSTSPFILFK